MITAFVTLSPDYEYNCKLLRSVRVNSFLIFLKEFLTKPGYGIKI